MQIIGLAQHLPGLTAFAFHQNRQCAPDHLILNLMLVLRDQGLQALQPVICFGRVNFGPF